MRKVVKAAAAFFNLALLTLTVLIVNYTVKLPDEFYVTKGSGLNLRCYFDVKAEKDTSEKSAKTVSSIETVPVQDELTLKLFGFVPVKTVTVTEVERTVLVPGGGAFGIKLLTDGVIVIGTGEISCGGYSVSPAEDAGIKCGDIVVSVNGKKVTSNRQIRELIDKCGGDPLEVELIRGGKEVALSLQPVYSDADSCYKAGMWVRDSGAGIGTITYYDPATGRFGGLGHPVCDIDTGGIMPISSGEVVDVSINGINRSSEGAPGELIGTFSSVTASGLLDKNTPSGVFGTLFTAPCYDSAVPLAQKQEIHLGEAEIITTVSGSKPQRYSILIEKIDLRDEGTKNMVIRITDPELLELTGGIVQGMSGSPIIQNNMLAGAVTHVFVSDPTKGYAIFAENMFEEGK